MFITQYNTQISHHYDPRIQERMIIYNKLKRDIKILRTFNRKKAQIEIIEAEVCPDHIHMLVEIPPEIQVSSFLWDI